MAHAFICDYVRTPIGRYGGGLAIVRADDLGAVPIKALMARNNQVDWGAVDEVCFGCANQAGEDNRLGLLKRLRKPLRETMRMSVIASDN